MWRRFPSQRRGRRWTRCQPERTHPNSPPKGDLRVDTPEGSPPSGAGILHAPAQRKSMKSGWVRRNLPVALATYIGATRMKSATPSGQASSWEPKPDVESAGLSRSLPFRRLHLFSRLLRPQIPILRFHIGGKHPFEHGSFLFVVLEDILHGGLADHVVGEAVDVL